MNFFFGFQINQRFGPLAGLMVTGEVELASHTSEALNGPAVVIYKC